MAPLIIWSLAHKQNCNSWGRVYCVDCTQVLFNRQQITCVPIVMAPLTSHLATIGGGRVDCTQVICCRLKRTIATGEYWRQVTCVPIVTAPSTLPRIQKCNSCRRVYWYTRDYWGNHFYRYTSDYQGGHFYQYTSDLLFPSVHKWPCKLLITMGWLWLVGSLKLQVSFAE